MNSYPRFTPAVVPFAIAAPPTAAVPPSAVAPSPEAPAPGSPAPKAGPAPSIGASDGPSEQTLVNDRIFIGSNSVAQWFVTLGTHEGKPALVAHQVFIDAPKHMGAVARTLAKGRLFFSMRQLETMMSLRHNLDVAVSEGDRLRIARHLRGLRLDL